MAVTWAKQTQAVMVDFCECTWSTSGGIRVVSLHTGPKVVAWRKLASPWPFPEGRSYGAMHLSVRIYLKYLAYLDHTKVII